MHVLKRRYKVLAPQSWMRDRLINQDILAGFHTPAFAIFGRPGIYYDRVYDYAWFELDDGRAFKYDKRMFAYELNQLRVWYKYNHRQYEALQHVVKEKVATRQQRSDRWAYRQELMCISVRRDAQCFTQRTLGAR